MQAPTANSDSIITGTIDHAATVQDDQESPVSGPSTTTLTNVDASGPLANGTSTMTVIGADAPGPLDSGTSTTAVANEDDAQALRTVSPSARTSVTVAQSMQMFNGSYHPEFNNSVLSNVGGNKNETNNVYHIYGNATVYCSSADLAALRINSTGSSEIALQDATSSQSEHVSHGDTKTGSTLHASTEEIRSTGIQTGVTTPHRIPRELSSGKDQTGCLDACAQDHEDLQTPAIDGGHALDIEYW
ncbi:hypothetical protein K435DRAFT_848718 [Dendrothele bispora CBS 962.96]|uniref:Uncharacterized protein n=1 Tax=Dendrothele bispora (strain CBS 962.96) TaxID=1314807 RepID=A0A4S8MU64_DENBC|nr:hypothetical protein K435DRAFT_848718 [Dendrothele bispora CBS 962.96]